MELLNRLEAISLQLDQLEDEIKLKAENERQWMINAHLSLEGDLEGRINQANDRFTDEQRLAYSQPGLESRGLVPVRL